MQFVHREREVALSQSAREAGLKRLRHTLSLGNGPWVLCGLALLYGSLLPFRFSLSALAMGLHNWPTGFGLTLTTREDLLTNVLVYLPLGFLFVLSRTIARFGNGAGVLAAMVIGALLSVTAETLQLGLAIRVSAWSDVLLNVVGTGVGAVLGLTWRRWGSIGLDTVRAAWMRRPFSTLATVLTLGLFLYGLAPFDFVIDTPGLHASFGRARLDLSKFSAMCFGQQPWTSWVGELSSAAWFGVLGLLLSASYREHGRDRVNALAGSLRDGCILIVLIEFMQLFTASHVFDSSTMVLRSLILTLGVWCAFFMSDSFEARLVQRENRRVVPTSLLIMLVIMQVGVIVLGRADLAKIASMQFVWTAPRSMPFETLWRASSAAALAHILSSLVTFGALAVTTVILMSRTRLRWAWLISWVCVAVLAAALEWVPSPGGRVSPDVTGPILGAWSAGIAIRVYSQASKVRVVQEL